MSDDSVEQKISAVLAESDPDKRIAMARRLRAEVWDMLGDDELERLARNGLDVDRMRSVMRRIK